MSAEVELSVVVAFRDAAPYLEEQLEALAGQRAERPWQVVLVDNGSRDGSRRVAERFAGRLDLLLLDARARRGAGHARNVGARHASGDKLVFVDADDEVAPGFVGAMSDALDRRGFVTSSFDHRALNPRWTQAAHGLHWRDPADPLPPLLGFLPSAGGSIGIRRSVFESVGGFREEFLRMQDIVLSWDVQLAGTPLEYVPEAVYRVRYRASLRGLYRQTFTWGTYGPLLYGRYRAAGMPRKAVGRWLKEWASLARDFLAARGMEEVAPLVVLLGYRTGFLVGSLRHRTLYLGPP